MPVNIRSGFMCAFCGIDGGVFPNCSSDRADSGPTTLDTPLASPSGALLEKNME